MTIEDVLFSPFILVGLIFGMMSLLLNHNGQIKFSILFLILAGACIMLQAISYDNFLNVWDERFHALVSKNLTSNFLKPTLYNNVPFDFDHSGWDKEIIWLHKQPLFLWQMMLALKYFGLNEISVRLPSFLLIVFSIYPIYRIGYIWLSRSSGIVLSLLIISSNYIIELVAGRNATDHNDLVFFVYVSLSFWAWTEYQLKKNNAWLIVLGLLVGFAVLTKWLVGLIVFFGWSVTIIVYYKKNVLEIKKLLFTFFISAITFIPWQIYSLINYPVEAKKEMGYNSLHFFKALEGHRGEWNYHLNMFDALFGKYSLILFLLGILFFCFSRFSNKRIGVFFISMIFGVELFFGFAKTKMPSFTMILGIPILFFISFLFYRLEKYFLRRNIPKAQFGLILIVFLLFFTKVDFKELRQNHQITNSNNYQGIMTHNALQFKKFSHENPGTVVFNVKGRQYVEGMFYSNCLFFNFYPSELQLNKCYEAGRKVIILHDEEIDKKWKTDKRVVYQKSKFKGNF
ncbi:MAG: 4-amino-4-deoxy-L-arabinose transferase-like glycosyltransferase [Vicingaceae bacterium]|jgi:4-amino-4-deoxy-L-arabinose transferase-like glycosyltransferase